jgi:hypothetical protein
MGAPLISHEYTHAQQQGAKVRQPPGTPHAEQTIEQGADAVPIMDAIRQNALTTGAIQNYDDPIPTEYYDKAVDGLGPLPFGNREYYSPQFQRLYREASPAIQKYMRGKVVRNDQQPGGPKMASNLKQFMVKQALVQDPYPDKSILRQAERILNYLPQNDIYIAGSERAQWLPYVYRLLSEGHSSDKITDIMDYNITNMVDYGQDDSENAHKYPDITHNGQGIDLRHFWDIHAKNIEGGRSTSYINELTDSQLNQLVQETEAQKDIQESHATGGIKWPAGETYESFYRWTDDILNRFGPGGRLLSTGKPRPWNQATQQFHPRGSVGETEALEDLKQQAAKRKTKD